MKKRLISLLAMFCLIAAMVPAPVRAADGDALPDADATPPPIPTTGDVWDGVTTTAPTKIVQKDDVNYYEITQCAELAFLAQEGNEDWLKYNYLLTNDLILNDMPLTWDDGGNLTNSEPEKLNKWTPIGGHYSFSGIFNGGGHTISRLYVDGGNGGLFGSCSSIGSTVTNINVNGYVKGPGGIVGSGNTCTNCTFSGVVIGRGYVGGIIGYGFGSTTNCVNYGTVIGTSGTSLTSGTNAVGGIIGFAGTVISGGNSSTGTATNCANYGTISGESDVGGIAGSSIYRTIARCVNRGAVTGKTNVGGVVGDGSVENCYNTAVVTGVDNVGGISGSGSITNCYNIGKIFSVNNGLVGAIVGSDNAIWNQGTVSGCYYLQSDGLYGCGGVSSPEFEPKGLYAKFADELKQQKTFVSWNFDGNYYSGPVWAIASNRNNGYPYLAMEDDLPSAPETPSNPPDIPGHTHAWATGWTVDETAHWHECEAEDCGVTVNGEKSGYGKHTPGDWIVDQEASVNAAGSRHKECTVCKYTTETGTIPKLEPDTPPATTYKITITDSVNGSVSANKTTAAKGEIVTLTVTPDKGYQFKEFIVKPDTIVIKDNSFTMPEENVEISTVFEPAPLTGTVTVTGTPRSGETLTVSVADSNNTGTLSYQWNADGTAITGAAGTTYTLTDAEIGKKIICTVTSSVQTESIKSAETAAVVAKDTELTAYKVTFNMNGHGMAPAEQTVYAGGKATKPADPTASGYTFGGWFKDAAGTTAFDFDNEVITANTVIYAKWTENQSSGGDSATYTITIASAANGSVTTDKTSAKRGETVTLTISPNSGYSLSAISTTPALTLNGSGNIRTFTMPDSNVTVSATFAANSSVSYLTGYVDIEGEPWVGETLRAVVWSTNNTGVLYYQWTADGYNLYGETSRYLNLTRYEVGKVIRCVVTSSVQTGSITGRLWGTVDYYDSRYYPSSGSTGNNTSGNNSTSNGTNQNGNSSSAGTGNDSVPELPIFTTATNTDGTKTTTINQPDGSSGLVAMTSYGTVSAASMTFSSSAVASALRTGSALTIPAAVQPSRDVNSATPVQVVLPQATGAVKVKIPVSRMTAGTVAVIQNSFGPDRVIKSSVSGSDGVEFELTGSAVVKIVDNTKSFLDVFDDTWYGDAVKWASSREVMNGVSPQMFDPQGTMNRAMMTQMLYNYDDAANTGVVSQFSDVSSRDWYADSVSWATKNGIARNNGGRFGAEDALTREDMATMLYNYAKAKGYSTSASGSTTAFPDNGDVSDWARIAMQWAVGAGLINGTQNGTRTVVLDPQGTVTRAQLATIMQRFNNLY